MKRCPQCEYLVPSSWDECEQCGAELRSAPAVLPLGTTPNERIVKPYQVPDARHRSTGSPVSTARRPPTIVIAPPRGQPAGPARSSQSYRSSQSSQSSRQGDLAESVPTPRRRRRISVPIMGPLAILLMGIAAWVAFQRVAHPPVPSEIRAWVEQGRGVTYAPAGESFSLSLPTKVTESSNRIALSPGVEGYARSAVSTVGEREYGVSWVRVVPSNLSNRGQKLSQSVTEIAERAGGLRIFVSNESTRNGRLTVSAEIERSGHDGKAFVQLVDDTIYVVFTDGPSPSSAGFEHLVRSLQISPPRV